MLEGLCNETEALAIVNAELTAVGAQPMGRSTWARCVRPLLQSLEVAVPVGSRSWLYARLALPAWAAYIAERQRRIAAGEWSEKRPYSIADLQSSVKTT